MDDIGALVDELRRVVRDRRASGQYPEGLEEDLDEHFLRAVPGALDALDIDARLRLVDRAALIGRHRVYTDSRVPLGSVVHKAVGRVVVRQTNSLLDQLAQFAVTVRSLLHAIVERLPEEDFRDTAARVDVILDRLAAYERVPETADPVVRSLAARLDRLEAWMNAASAPPGQFDGVPWSQEDDQRMHGAVVALQLSGPSLDLSGESDPADAVAALEARADETLASVVLTSGAERLAAQRMRNLLAVAANKLRPGGILALGLCEAPVLTGENVDGRSVLTWSPGVAADRVGSLAESAGFSRVRVEWIGGEADGGITLEAPAAIAEELERLRRRVAQLERRSRPYLLVCTR
jgi:ubiquinone biosynthesis protein UbiJ